MILDSEEEMIIYVFKPEFRRAFREMTSESFLEKKVVACQLHKKIKNMLGRNSLDKDSGIKDHDLFG